MKNQVATRNTQILVEAIPPSPKMDAAGRINYYHILSKQAGEVAIKAALAAGLELVKVQLANPGKLFDEWIDANCSFSRRTAFHYMATLKQTIGASMELGRLVNGSDDDRRSAIDAFAASTDSKSLTELYADLGIVHKTKSNLGGRREGAGRPRKLTAEEMQAQADALAKDPETAWNELKSLMDQLDAFVVVRDGLGLLDDDRLAAFHAQASFWLERAADILEGRRGNGKVVRT